MSTAQNHRKRGVSRQVLGTPDEKCRASLVLKEHRGGVSVVVLTGHLVIALCCQHGAPVALSNAAIQESP